MKRFIALLAVLTVVSINLSQAQAWNNFWHPRPPIYKTTEGTFGATAPASVWEFKPTLSLIAMSFTPPTAGGAWVNSLFNGAGPALTYQYETQDANGVNFAQYSVSFGVYFAGSTNTDPNFQPAVALMAGALNNVVNLGAGYRITTQVNGSSRFFLLASFNLNLTQN
jgi:hypothetical protein